ncbi:MAG: hypothetical protein A7316_08530 [Candidatus Altiarchaeales archaeon WOR_SM1_86-2]|nr:MAG: hypothetical protein A7316_08530 [Candidatus Altiarchaeales archaeon WOR_SM1_86-2]ODS41652.1 MAG: hypothetical protein A7315_00850 [Candidatus Altiarchaeales archaeon WOR_SM1_79]
MISASNTSPLIFASKVPEILDLLKSTYEGIIIPLEVYREAVEDALRILDELLANQYRLSIKDYKRIMALL